MFVILLCFLLFEISVLVSFLSPRPVNLFLKMSFYYCFINMFCRIYFVCIKFMLCFTVKQTVMTKVWEY